MRSYSVFLSLSDISLGIMSSKSIHIIKWQCFLLSHLWIIFRCVYVPIFLFHSSFNGHPSYFHTYDFLVYCRPASCVILGKPWPHFLCIYFCYLLIWLHWILVAACGIFVAVWGLCRCCLSQGSAPLCQSLESVPSSVITDGASHLVKCILLLCAPLSEA